MMQPPGRNENGCHKDPGKGASRRDMLAAHLASLGVCCRSRRRTPMGEQGNKDEMVSALWCRVCGVRFLVCRQIVWPLGNFREAANGGACVTACRSIGVPVANRCGSRESFAFVNYRPASTAIFVVNSQGRICGVKYFGFLGRCMSCGRAPCGAGAVQE